MNQSLKYNIDIETVGNAKADYHKPIASMYLFTFQFFCTVTFCVGIVMIFLYHGLFECSEHLYFFGENNGTEKLRSYCEADLRLCFCIGKNPVFL